jgi:hypothetical protein
MLDALAAYKGSQGWSECVTLCDALKKYVSGIPSGPAQTITSYLGFKLGEDCVNKCTDKCCDYEKK